MATTVSSKQFTLNLSDFWKGLIMAVIGAVIGIITDSINQGNFEFNWAAIWKGALAAGLAYIAKNFFDKPKIVITNPDATSVQQVIDGEAKAVVVPTQK